MSDCWLGLCHESPQEVVGEELEQEHGVVGIEAGAGDLAEPERVFQITDDRLDLGPSVVLGRYLLGGREPVVGHVELDGFVGVLDAELLSRATLCGRRATTRQGSGI